MLFPKPDHQMKIKGALYNLRRDRRICCYGEDFSFLGESSRSHVSAQALFVQDVSMMRGAERIRLTALVLNLTSAVDTWTSVAV